MTETLRLAVAGAGYFSRFHYAAWARIPEVRLVGICETDGDKARAVAGTSGNVAVFDDFADMLDKARPDLVDIVTPPQTHLDFVRETAGRGVPAICQKAFCTSLAEAESAAAAVSDRGATLAIHENFRFQPWYRAIRDEIARGRIGRPLQIGFRLRPGDGQGPDAYLDRQPYFREMERFLVHETAVHWIDTFRFLFGEVAAVSAVLRRINPVVAGEDAGFVVFEFTSGAAGMFDGNRLTDHVSDNRRRTMGEMLVEGEAGTLTLRGDGSVAFRAFGENEETAVNFSWRDDSFGGDCVFQLQRHVVDHLLYGMALENDVVSYLPNLRIEAAIYQSHAEARRIATTPDRCA